MPQGGSSLGPILYLIYVNDHPNAIYNNDALITQFADDDDDDDDVVHIVCSDGGQVKSRTKQAKIKLEHELEQTLNWEKQWKIKSNIQKSTVHYMRTSQTHLEGTTIRRHYLR